MAKKSFSIPTPTTIPKELLTTEEGSALAVQTFYMVALKNHIKLSGMVDKKSNIILAVCALLISGVLTNSLKFVQDTGDQYLLVPTAIFLVFMLVAMILSIIATVPKVTSGAYDKDAIAAHDVNLAFFGNFHKMPLEAYQEAVIDMQKDAKEIYKVLTKDLYFLGVVLDKKFRLLNVTYAILIIGVVTSVAAYIFAFYNHNM